MNTVQPPGDLSHSEVHGLRPLCASHGRGAAVVVTAQQQSGEGRTPITKYSLQRTTYNITVHFFFLN